MFIDYKKMERFGYHPPKNSVLNTNHYYIYYKHYPENNSFVMYYSRSEKIRTVFLTEEIYKSFQNSKISLSFFINWDNTKDVYGNKTYYAMNEVIKEGIDSLKELKENLLIAEEKAQDKNLSDLYNNHRMVCRGKVIPV